MDTDLVMSADGDEYPPFLMIETGLLGEGIGCGLISVDGELSVTR
jgi:hypothetical protein